MGNSTNGKGVNISKQYGIKPELVKVIDNKIYLQQERHEIKLPQQVLAAFTKGNNFSCDADEEKK